MFLLCIVDINLHSDLVGRSPTHDRFVALPGIVIDSEDEAEGRLRRKA